MIPARSAEVLRLELLLKDRGTRAWKTTLSHVFVEYSEPTCHGNSYWNVCLGLNSGPGTDTLKDTWTYSHPTYEAGVRALLDRPMVLQPSWQEKLNSAMSFWWNGETDNWFLEHYSQEAWDKCTNGQAMLWVLHHTHRHDPLALAVICWDIVLCCQDVLMKMIDSDLIVSLHKEIAKSLKTASQSRSTGQQFAARAVDAFYQDDPHIETELKRRIVTPVRSKETEDLARWYAARMYSCLDAVMAGATERAFHVAYYAERFGLKKQTITDVIRNHYAVQQFEGEHLQCTG